MDKDSKDERLGYMKTEKFKYSSKGFIE